MVRYLGIKTPQSMLWIGSNRSMRVMTSFMATTTLRRSAILCKDYGTEDWQQSLWLACYVSLWYMIHFGGHFKLSAQRGQEFVTTNFNRTAIIHDPSRLIRIYIFLTSDLKKGWWDLYITSSIEYWNCKFGCGSSPVTRVSHSPLPCEKRSAWAGGCCSTILK